MKVEYKEGVGWWITDMPDDGVERYHKRSPENCGPYATRAEAEDDLPGLRRFYEHHEELGFMTIEDKP